MPHLYVHCTRVYTPLRRDIRPQISNNNLGGEGWGLGPPVREKGGFEVPGPPPTPPNTSETGGPGARPSATAQPPTATTTWDITPGRARPRARHNETTDPPRALLAFPAGFRPDWGGVTTARRSARLHTMYMGHVGPAAAPTYAQAGVSVFSR